MIKIFISSAENLSNPSSGSLPDPYVCVFSDSLGLHFSLGKNEYIKKTSNPVWDSDFSKPIVFPFFYAEKLVLNIYDHYRLLKDQWIGSAFVSLQPKDHDKIIKVPVITKNSQSSDNLLEPTITIKICLPEKNFMLNHHIKDCYGYHIFFTYPEQFFPEPSEFKIYTREFTKAGNDIKCAQLNTNIESLPYFQCSNTLLYGPSGLTPFIRLLFNHSLYVIFITSTTYIGDVTVNFVTIPYFCEFYTGNQITVRNIFHHIMVMQVTVHVSPGVLTLVPVTISPIGIKKVSTNNLIYDMSCDINSCVSKVLYPSKRLWQRIISIPENPVTLLQALDFLRLNSPPSISVALGWENCDIDLSCVTYCLTKSNSYRISRVVYYSNLNAYNGSIEHSGNCPYGCEVDEDGKQGRNEDDETIRIKLTQLPKSIKFIAFCVSSCHEKQLDSVDAGYMRVTSLSKTFEFLFFPLSKAKHTASVIALAERKENDIWDIIPLYYNMNRKQPTELADSFLEVLNNEEAFKNIMSEALKNKGDPKYLI